MEAEGDKDNSDNIINILHQDKNVHNLSPDLVNLKVQILYAVLRVVQDNSGLQGEEQVSVALNRVLSYFEELEDNWFSEDMERYTFPPFYYHIMDVLEMEGKTSQTVVGFFKNVCEAEGTVPLTQCLKLETRPACRFSIPSLSLQFGEGEEVEDELYATGDNEDREGDGVHEADFDCETKAPSDADDVALIADRVEALELSTDEESPRTHFLNCC